MFCFEKVQMQSSCTNAQIDFLTSTNLNPWGRFNSSGHKIWFTTTTFWKPLQILNYNLKKVLNLDHKKLIAAAVKGQQMSLLHFHVLIQQQLICLRKKSIQIQIVKLKLSFSFMHFVNIVSNRDYLNLSDRTISIILSVKAECGLHMWRKKKTGCSALMTLNWYKWNGIVILVVLLKSIYWMVSVFYFKIVTSVWEHPFVSVWLFSPSSSPFPSPLWVSELLREHLRHIRTLQVWQMKTHLCTAQQLPVPCDQIWFWVLLI